jgi:GxxExxY protein
MLFAKEDTSNDPLTHKIIGAAIEVHRTLGPGLLESVYEECLCFELRSLGLPYVRQSPIPVIYKGKPVDCAFRADVIVENKVLVEIKACEAIIPIHEAFVLTYMKLTGIHRSLLVNFNVLLLKDGVRRYVL